MNHKSEHEPGPEPSDPRLDAVLQTIASASRRYAIRFGIERLREEIEAESVMRVVALISEARTPFDADPSLNDDATDRMQRFTHGLVANVARETLRGRVRHAHAQLEDRAGACETLRVGEAAPEHRIELEESIDQAMAAFKSLPGDVRETIVAEEIIQHQYASDDADRLCRSCEVSFTRVWTMIENRNSGAWSAEAWRQRVHRSRKKARAAVGALAAFTLSIALLVGVLAAVSASDAADADTPPAPIADNGSTQNGKSNAPAITVLASTQNGSHGTSMGGDGTGSDGTSLPA